MIPVEAIFERYPEIKEEFYRKLFEEMEKSRKAITEDVRRSYEYTDTITMKALRNNLVYESRYRAYMITDWDINRDDNLVKFFKEKK